MEVVGKEGREGGREGGRKKKRGKEERSEMSWCRIKNGKAKYA